MAGKLLVCCTHGAEDALRVTAAYLAAAGGVDEGRHVALWLTSDGVRLATDGYLEGIRAAPGGPAVQELHDRVIAGGGRLFACDVSMAALGVDPATLSEQARAATAAEVLAWAGDDALAVSF